MDPLSALWRSHHCPSPGGTTMDPLSALWRSHHCPSPGGTTMDPLLALWQSYHCPSPGETTMDPLLALWQSYHCPSPGETTMDPLLTWINFNPSGTTIEVWQWISNFNPILSCLCDYLSMLWFKWRRRVPWRIWIHMPGSHTDACINSLAPGRFQFNFR